MKKKLHLNMPYCNPAGLGLMDFILHTGQLVEFKWTLIQVRGCSQELKDPLNQIT